MKFIITLLLLLMIATSAFGQSKITALTYNVSIPDGDMKNYIDETSWRGFGFDGKWFVDGDRPLTLGIALAWHVFNETTDGTIVLDQGALTGHQNRYVNSFPMMLTAHYYFGNRNQLWAYLGVGAGAYYMIQRFEIGVWAFEETHWHFGVVPEFGIQIPLSEADFLINVKYNYAFASGEPIAGDPIDWTYWGINVGLAYSDW